MTNQVDIGENLKRKNWYIDFMAVPALMAVLLLLGHYGLFYGETFLTNGDIIISFDYQTNNSKTGGWRPDVALGQSFFVGDPGMSHVWGLNRFFGEIFSDKHIGYQIQILLTIWLSCFVLYLFLEKTAPEIGRAVSFLLSTTIAFGSLRYEFSFIFIEVPATCLVSLVLSDFFKQPKLKHYFYYTSIIFASAFLGSTSSTFKILNFAGIFSIGIAVYNRWYFLGKDLGKALKRFFLLNCASGLSLLILGAWIFYSIFIEMKTTGYTRDPDYSVDHFFFWPGVHQAALHLFNYFNAGLFPVSVGDLGIIQNLDVHSWTNFSPLFPVIFLLIVAQKNKTFWEFISKFVIIVLFLLQELVMWLPGILDPLAKSMLYYPPAKTHTSIQVFEIILTGILIVRLRNYGENFQGWFVKIAKTIAGFLVLLYCGLFVFVFFARVAPKFLSKVVNTFIQGVTSVSQGEFLSTVAVENIRLFNEAAGWNLLIFYGTTALFLAVLFSKNWSRLFLVKGGLVFSIVLLINNLFLSWSVYPLAQRPLIWDKIEMNGKPLVENLKPTDRLIRVGITQCSEGLEGISYNKCIENKFFNGEFGPYRHIIGYEYTPALEFSKSKSVTPQPVTDFVETFTRLEGIVQPWSRDAPYTRPFFNSRLYDISAVNYVFSEHLIRPIVNLELVFKSKQFYLYRNLNAWPYFYLADNIKTIGSYEDLYEAEQGTAYLWEHDKTTTIQEKTSKSNRTIELIKFKYGDLKFKYESNEPELLVIADSWHPNWHATVNGSKVRILKANGVFKGILLPPGKGSIELYFDNSPYQFGILISVIAWVIFILCWVGAAKRLPKIY